MGVEYDVFFSFKFWCIFFFYLKCENYMKLLNYDGDVVGVYICNVHICCS